MGRGMVQVPFGNTFVSRLAPLASPLAYKTYQMKLPLATHWRSATCEEADCPDFANGFVTKLDVSTGQGAILADMIRKGKTGRSFTENRPPGTITEFTFPPGTPCFAGGHKVRVERPATFLTVGGDWRGNPAGQRRVHKNGTEWAEDCAEHLDRINTERNRG
jgi:hypothetical protein